jgi:hypothetical protein
MLQAFKKRIRWLQTTRCFSVEPFLHDGVSRVTKDNLLVNKKITYKHKLLLFITYNYSQTKTYLFALGRLKRHLFLSGVEPGTIVWLGSGVLNDKRKLRNSRFALGWATRLAGQKRRSEKTAFFAMIRLEGVDQSCPDRPRVLG